MDSKEASDFFMIFIFLIPIFWGVLIGKKIGLKYWLYDSFDGFNTSFGLPFGAFLSLISYNVFMDGDGNFVTSIFFIIGVIMFLNSSVKLYKITINQTYTKADAIVLFLGKIAFTILTMGIILLIAFAFMRKKN